MQRTLRQSLSWRAPSPVRSAATFLLMLALGTLLVAAPPLGSSVLAQEPAADPSALTQPGALGDAGQPAPVPVPPSALDPSLDPATAKSLDTVTDPAAEEERVNDDTIRERTIYVPYQRLKQIFEKQGRGVFLPYEKFEELWRAARVALARPEDPKPPVSALITSIDSKATVEQDVMRVNATIEIELLEKGWHEIPLRLSQAAIRSATIDGKPARVIASDAGYKLLVKHGDKEPGRLTLLLDYSRAFAKEPGNNRVQLDAPQAPVNRWEIRIPQPGVQVQVLPQLASSDAAGGMMQPADPAAKETVVQALVGSADLVDISWTAKAEGAAGLTALVTAQVRQEVMIDEGVIRTRATLQYDITRADLKELRIEVPTEHDVVNVFDPNVQKWEKKVEDGVQTIIVQLFQGARGTQNLTLELERFLGDKEMPQEMTRQEIIAPVIRAVGVVRQQGLVLVKLADSLRAEVTARSNLFQIDASELPETVAGQTFAFSFRYATLPFQLAMIVEKVQPLVEVEQLVEVYVEPQQTSISLLAIYNIQRAGVFQLQLDVPEGYDVRQVQGRAAAGAEALLVDSYHVDDVMVDGKPQKTKLIVNLARKAMGLLGLQVELNRRQEDQNLLLPTGKSSVVAIPVPRVAMTGIHRASGRVILYAPESLRISPTEQKGLRAISPAEALVGVQSIRDNRFQTTRELLAYAFTQEPVSLVLEAERRQPQLTSDQWLSIRVEPGVVKYQATFHTDVLYSGVKSLRIDMPKALYPAEIRNQSPTIRDRVMAPQPEDVAADMVAVELTTEGEFLGGSDVVFAWEQKLASLEVGKPLTVVPPRLIPRDVDRNHGQITISKAETIDIGIEKMSSSLRAIDPQRDLRRAASGADIARALEYHDDWDLTLLATRYQLEEVKRTSIELALVRMVVTRSSQVSVQALYRLRSARQRLAVKLPASVDTETAFDTQPLQINGQPAQLEKDSTQLYIPLAGQSSDAPILVELRYTYDGSASSLQLPEFPEEPAVQQVYVSVYLPDEHTILGVSGPWNDLEQPRFPPGSYPSSPPSDDQLLSQLRGGIPNCDLAGGSFPVDGTRRLLSAIRPESGSSGAAHITSMHRTTLSVIVFLLLAIAGVALTMRPFVERIWALAAVLVALVLLAAIAPTFSAALLAAPLGAALFIVLAAWSIRALLWGVPRCMSACQACCGRWFSLVPSLATSSPTGDVPFRSSPSPDSPSPTGTPTTTPASESTLPSTDATGDKATGNDAGSDDSSKKGDA